MAIGFFWHGNGTLTIMVHFMFRKARLSDDYLPSWYLYEDGKRNGIIVYENGRGHFLYFSTAPNQMRNSELCSYRTLREAKLQAINAYVKENYPELLIP